MIVLPEKWSRHWVGGDPFDFIFSLRGEVYRDKDARKTIRFELDGDSYFAKLHYGIGWKGLLKSLLRFRKPVPGATNEWRAIQKLAAIGQPTMTLAGYGREAKHPLTARSFVITKELRHTISLEDLCREWPNRPPDVRLKRALIRKVAEMTREIHGAGMIHKDLYICHFLLDRSQRGSVDDPGDVRLYLIDLHRVVIGPPASRRWLVKDIAALYFSSMDIGLTRRDLLRFVSVYRDRPLRDVFSQEPGFWQRVEKKGRSFHREFQRKHPKPVIQRDGSPFA